jgi:hypothetical protein
MTTAERHTNASGVALTVGLGVTSFAPTVCIDGRTLEPAGWMWVLGFALAGCDWAVKEAETPEFKARAAEWMRDRKRLEAEQEITALERRIAEIRARLTPNSSSPTDSVG